MRTHWLSSLGLPAAYWWVHRGCPPLSPAGSGCQCSCLSPLLSSCEDLLFDNPIWKQSWSWLWPRARRKGPGWKESWWFGWWEEAALGGPGLSRLGSGLLAEGVAAQGCLELALLGGVPGNLGPTGFTEAPGLLRILLAASLAVLMVAHYKFNFLFCIKILFFPRGM